MLLIQCPWCGVRDEVEFLAGGEAGRIRPLEPSSTSDREWGDFLFMRRNAKGQQLERWYHRSGCRRWFAAERDTASHVIAQTFELASAATSEAAGQ